MGQGGAEEATQSAEAGGEAQAALPPSTPGKAPDIEEGKRGTPLEKAKPLKGISEKVVRRPLP